MNTKYLTREERKAAKKAARKARKVILASLSPKELASWNKVKGEKGLRTFAETVGKNVPRPEVEGKRMPGQK